MATKAEERTHGCFAKAAEDEPLFVLRAQDVLAPLAVRSWAMLAAAATINPDKVAEAEALADAMVAWQNQNHSKLPD